MSAEDAVRQAVANSRLEGHLTPHADLPLLHAVARGEVTADEAVVLFREWAEDINNDCWSLEALPSALRRRADELDPKGTP